MKALIELAMANVEKESTSNVSDLVKQAMEAHKEAQKSASFQEIVELLNIIEAHKGSQRQEIRKLKAQLKRLTISLDDLDRRWAYAQESNNFLPVLAFFGKVTPADLDNPEDFAKLTSVPSDFVFKTE